MQTTHSKSVILSRHYWCAVPLIKTHSEQGCESSDFNLISDFFSLRKTPFSDF